MDWIQSPMVSQSMGLNMPVDSPKSCNPVSKDCTLM